MKKLSENASCSSCKFRGNMENEYYNCIKKGKMKPSDICKKYTFDPLAPRMKRQRRFDTTMFDPLDFDINL